MHQKDQDDQGEGSWGVKTPLVLNVTHAITLPVYELCKWTKTSGFFDVIGWNFPIHHLSIQPVQPSLRDSDDFDPLLIHSGPIFDWLFGPILDQFLAILTQLWLFLHNLTHFRWYEPISDHFVTIWSNMWHWLMNFTHFWCISDDLDLFLMIWTYFWWSGVWTRF